MKRLIARRWDFSTIRTLKRALAILVMLASFPAHGASAPRENRHLTSGELLGCWEKPTGACEGRVVSQSSITICLKHKGEATTAVFGCGLAGGEGFGFGGVKYSIRGGRLKLSTDSDDADGWIGHSSTFSCRLAREDGNKISLANCGDDFNLSGEWHRIPDLP
jgi:hypothetical protein